MKLSNESATERGVRTNHSRMPNGEYRFRLLSEDGSCYVRTEACGRGAWQKSHLHHNTYELYVVQSGWIAIAVKSGSEVRIRTYRENEHCIIEPESAHNVYLGAEAVLHTVKYGGCPENDWIPYEELDEETKRMTDEDIKAANEKQSEVLED